MLYFHYQFGSCSEAAKQGCEKTDVDNIMLFTLFYLKYKWKLALALFCFLILAFFHKLSFEHPCYTRVQGGGRGIIQSFKWGGSIWRAITPYPFVYTCTILIEKAPFVDLSLQKGTCTPLQAYLRILHPFSISLETS